MTDIELARIGGGTVTLHDARRKVRWSVDLEWAEMDAVLRFVERGLGVAIVPAMVLIDRPGLRSVRLEGPTLERTISVARPADVAPTAAVEVMRHTITASATAFAARAGQTMRLAGASA